MGVYTMEIDTRNGVPLKQIKQMDFHSPLIQTSQWRYQDTSNSVVTVHNSDMSQFASISSLGSTLTINSSIIKLLLGTIEHCLETKS